MIDIGLAGAFLGGVLTLLSPCSVMLLPAFFAYAFGSPRRLLGRTSVFLLGLLATLVPLGILAGLVGRFVTENRSLLVAVAATVIILLGLLQLSGLPIPGITRTSGNESTSPVAVFLLGAVYGVAGVCAGPILGSVLTVAALGGNSAYGAVLMSLYALGMAAPLFLLALLWNAWGGRVRGLVRPRELRIGKWRNSWTMVVAGALSVGIGILLLVTDGTTSLGGVLTIGQQYEAETWALGATSAIPDVVMLLVAVLLLAVLALVFALRKRQTASVAREETRR